MKYFCLVLIGLGLTISGYLLWRHFVLADLSAPARSDFCSALFGTGCDDALRSPLAVQLGLPLAGWGLVYYGMLISLVLLAWSLGEAFRFEAMTGALLLALAAAAGSVALFAAMATDLSPFCPLCAAVHGINVLLLFPIVRLTGRPVSHSIRAMVGAVRYVATGKATDPVAARWKSVGFVTPALVAVVVYQWVFVEFTSRTRVAEAPFDPQQIVAQFESTVQREIPLGATDPGLGPAQAPACMVVFSDFGCPGCRKLAQTVPALTHRFKDSLRVVFKHYPLDSACNSAVKRDLHPGACKAARAAEAAREQGQFWPFHDVLFAAHMGDDATMKSLAGNLDLDVGRFETHRAGNAGMARIQADIALGSRLGVDGTPAVFINGRRVYDLRPRALLLLIAREIRAADREAPEVKDGAGR